MSTKHATAESPFDATPSSGSSPEAASPRAPARHAHRNPAVRLLRNFFHPSEEFAGLARLDREELDERDEQDG